MLSPMAQYKSGKADLLRCVPYLCTLLTTHGTNIPIVAAALTVLFKTADSSRNTLALCTSKTGHCFSSGLTGDDPTVDGAGTPTVPGLAVASACSTKVCVCVEVSGMCSTTGRG